MLAPSPRRTRSFGSLQGAQRFGNTRRVRSHILGNDHRDEGDPVVYAQPGVYAAYIRGDGVGADSQPRRDRFVVTSLRDELDNEPFPGRQAAHPRRRFTNTA